MKVQLFATIPAIVLSLFGIIPPCEATGNMSTKDQRGLDTDEPRFPIAPNDEKHNSINRKLLDSASCDDSPLKVLTTKKTRSARTCAFIAGKSDKFCGRKAIKTHCPSACSVCNTFGTSDSSGTFIYDGKKMDCKWNGDTITPSNLSKVSALCEIDAIRETCRKTCSFFRPAASAVPSQAPSLLSCPEKIVSIIDSTFCELFIKPGSPQDRALEWLIGDIGDNCYDDDSIIQKFVLATLYYSTGGDSWSDNTGWLGGGDVCTGSGWYGLSCVSNQLTRISLYNNNLNGTIPSEIRGLTSLETLRLSSNPNLSGTLPDTIAGLVKLKYFYVDGNALTGTIPYLSAAINLQYFDASSNDFKGSIAGKFDGLTNLRYLLLHVNALTGTIPDLSGLLNLEYFRVSGNDFKGPIAGKFDGLTKLRNLSLDSNALTGTIPDLSGFVSLETLNLRKNDLTGPIAGKVDSLTNLKYVHLYNNELTGSIPDFAHNLNLERLSLDYNHISGRLDPQVFALPKLTHLTSYGNELTGPMPDNFGGSTSLKTIILSDNFFTGSIPGITGNSLENIETLYLQKNKMSGPVPDSICDLKSSKPDQFTYLWADCSPPNNAQNPCPSGCCTACATGKGLN